MRNDGPDAVSIAQVVVNDAFAQFTGADEPIGRLGSATVRVTQPWVEGEAYEVALLTSAGGTIVHEIPVAVETPSADLSFFGLMALLGIYVGVIPIALGMLWLPWLRRIPARWLRAVMAITVGLLAFLAIDATLEGLELAGEGAQAFGGASLVFLGALTAFLALTGVSAWLQDRRRAARGKGASAQQLALLVAVGIGLHNLGEGVAIGSAYATGALALGAFLVVGFALHNTTEGLAVVAPIAHERPSPAGSRSSACWPARPPSSAPGSARPRSTRASPRSCSASAPARSCRSSSRSRRACATTRAARCTRSRSAVCSAAWRSCSRRACWSEEERHDGSRRTNGSAPSMPGPLMAGTTEGAARPVSAGGGTRTPTPCGTRS